MYQRTIRTTLLLSLLLLAACSDSAISVNNTPPGASLIYPPVAGAEVFETTPVVLRGRVQDLEGGAEGLEYIFISDREGELGRGVSGPEGSSELPPLVLSVGEHQITLQVTDRVGASGSSTALLNVIPDQAPVMGLTTPADSNFLLGAPVILEGTVMDADNEVSTLVVVASSDTVELGSPPTVNAAGFEGTWFLVLNDVPVGQHAVVLQATDPLGKSGGVVVAFAVQPCVDTDGDGYSECNGDCDDSSAAIAPGRLELCNQIDDDCDGFLGAAETDDDGDGVTECDGDCNDAQATILPGATELCNGLDDDCDGSVSLDEMDLDADGVTGCDGDCDRTAPSVYPLAPEICDQVDNNCDGVLGPNELDTDGDGFAACQGDCVDTDATVHPGAVELCDGLDTDCAGGVPANEADVDVDGSRLCDADCDDTAPFTYPGAVELCDGVDNDCDGITPTTEIDGDGDAWLPCSGDCDDSEPTVFPLTFEACDGVDTDCDGAIPASEVDLDLDGWMLCNGDCDDTVPEAHPGATELCNQVDDDCDGIVPVLEIDDDGDGVADCQGDCNDSDATSFPGATELCDGVDNDCDGSLPVDEQDQDNDGWMACDGDCRDDLNSVYPGHVEICDALDNDCDGILLTFEVDNDGDGYPPCGLLGDSFDCDDSNPNVWSGPFVLELCDGLDNDCDGLVDSPPVYTDAGNSVDDDGDGYSEDAGDCNDCRGDIHPGAPETLDALDNDCDGAIDDGLIDDLLPPLSNSYVINGSQDGSSQMVDVAVGAGGELWAAWFQSSASDYYVASPTSEPWIWDISAPLSSGGTYSNLSLRVDSTGTPHLFGRSGSVGAEELIHATWDGSSWTTEVIDSTAGAGAFVYAVQEGADFVVAYRVDSTAEVRVAEGSYGAWSVTTLGTTGASETMVHAAVTTGAAAVSWFAPAYGGYVVAIDEGAGWVLETPPLASSPVDRGCSNGIAQRTCPSAGPQGIAFASNGSLGFVAGTDNAVLSFRPALGTWTPDYRAFEWPASVWVMEAPVRGVLFDSHDAFRVVWNSSFYWASRAYHFSDSAGLVSDNDTQALNQWADPRQTAWTGADGPLTAWAIRTGTGYVGLVW